MQKSFDDKAYWTNFYEELLAKDLNNKPSPFAKYLIDNNILEGNSTLLELGCGNGRDARFFAKNDYKVIAVDQCHNTTTYLDQINNIHSFADDFTNLAALKSKVDVVYSRFTLHSIGVEGEDRTLDWIKNNLSRDGVFCVEARTTKDPIFGKGIDKGGNIWFYNDHHRRFLVAEDFREKLINAGFKIKYFEESAGFAPYGDKDPVVLRAILNLSNS